MNRLRWIFEIVDRMSGPAAKATRAIDGLNRSMQTATATTARNDSATRSASSGGISSLIGKLGLAAAAYRGLQAAAGAAMGVVEAMAQRQSQERGFRMITGSQEEAERVLARSAQLADMLGMNVGEIRQQMQGLMGSGVGEDQAVRLTQAFADLSSLTPNLPIENLQRALTQMRGKGRVMAEELRGQFLEPAGAAGITQAALFEQIAPMLNIRPDQVNAAMEQGRILPEMFETAFLQVVANMSRRGGGEGLVGEMAANAAQGLGGQLARLQDLPNRIFTAMADESSVAGQALKRLLSQINAVFDPTTPGGQEMIATLVNGLTAMLAAVPRVISMFQELWSSISTGMEAAGISDLWKTFTEGVMDIAGPLGEVRGGFSLLKGVLTLVGFSLGLIIQWWRLQTRIIGTVISVVSSVINWFMRLPGVLRSVAAQMGAAIGQAVDFVTEGLNTMIATFTDIGGAVVTGFAEGIRSMIPSALTAITELGGASVMALRALLGIHSPSKVFMGLGEDTAEGFALGVEGGRSTTVASPGLGAFGGAGAAGMFGASLALTINVTANGSDGESIGESVRDAILPELLAFFDGFAIEAGA